MRYAGTFKAAALLGILIVAGALFPARDANAMIVSWVQCENVQGTVSDPYGNYTYTDVVCYEYSYDEATGDTGGDYDPPGGPYGGSNPTTCQALASIKNSIPNCNSPVAAPSTYDFAFSSFPSGSGLSYLVGYANLGGAYSISRTLVKSALKSQTLSNAQIFVSLGDATQTLLTKVDRACQYEAEFGTSPDAGALCAKAYGRLLQEAGAPSVADRFNDWLVVNGIDFELGAGFTVSLSTIMNFFSPGNSLTIKHDSAQAAQQCHDWWAQAQEAHCA
jgi:hypothetical protein